MPGSVVLSNRNYKYKCLEVWSADKKLGSISNPRRFWRSCWDHEAEPSCSNHDRLELPKVAGTSACTNCCWKIWLLGMSQWLFGLSSGFVKPCWLRGRPWLWPRAQPIFYSGALPGWRWVPSASSDAAERSCCLGSLVSNKHLILSRCLWWPRVLTGRTEVRWEDTCWFQVSLRSASPSTAIAEVTHCGSRMLELVGVCCLPTTWCGLHRSCGAALLLISSLAHPPKHYQENWRTWIFLFRKSLLLQFNEFHECNSLNYVKTKDVTLQELIY